MKKILGIALSVILLALPASADEIVLKNGMTVNNRITDRSEKWVRIDVSGMTVTYYNDEIESINGKAFKTETASQENMQLAQQAQDGVPIVVSHPSAVKVSTNPPVVTPPPIAPPDASTLKAPEPKVPAMTVTQDGTVKTKRPLKPKEAIGAIALMLFIVLFACLVFAYPVFLIAKKTGQPYPFFAFIPVLNFYLMCQIAGRPGWWLILLFVPLVNIAINVMIWMDIAVVCKKPKWMGVLIMVPLANLVLPWYLALMDNEGSI